MNGHVSSATTKRNLCWILAVALLAALHGCVWLQWQEAQDEAVHQQEAPAEYRE